MRILMLGTRGIPAEYGGFETCAEEISVRLAARGHEVSVFALSFAPGKSQTSYKGVRIINVQKMRSRHANFLAYLGISTPYAILKRPDVLHVFGSGRIATTVLARLGRQPTVLTLDGLEWERPSYPRITRVLLRAQAELAMVYPNATVVDSRAGQDWYFDRTGRKPIHIPYGVSLSDHVDEKVLDEYGLRRGGYLFFVGRLVPEKGVHLLIDAFNRIKTDARLVIVGDSLSTRDYVRELKDRADSRTMFLGYLYGKRMESLRNGSRICVHPSLLEGTSIALLGSMSAGRCIILSDIPENKEVAGEAGMYFKTGDSDDLKEKLQRTIETPGLTAEYGRKAFERASKLYNWDSIADSYERVYTEVVRSAGIGH